MPGVPLVVEPTSRRTFVVVRVTMGAMKLVPIVRPLKQPIQVEVVLSQYWMV